MGKELGKQKIPNMITWVMRGLVDFLAFADLLAFLVNSVETTVKQANVLGYQVAKVGLKMLMEMTKYLAISGNHQRTTTRAEKRHESLQSVI